MHAINGSSLITKKTQTKPDKGFIRVFFTAILYAKHKGIPPPVAVILHPPITTG